MAFDNLQAEHQRSRSETPSGLSCRSAGGPLPDSPERGLAWSAYDEHFESVWRLLRRLGVLEHRLDDAVQDVFMTVHRRAAEFRGDSQLRTWVLGIAVRVAANVRRVTQREASRHAELSEALSNPGPLPDEEAARHQAVVMLHELLAKLSEGHRELIVLVDLEQLGVVEAAEILGINSSTCYKRLAVARTRFNAEVERMRAFDEWRLR